MESREQKDFFSSKEKKSNNHLPSTFDNQNIIHEEITSLLFAQEGEETQETIHDEYGKIRPAGKILKRKIFESLTEADILLFRKLNYACETQKEVIKILLNLLVHAGTTTILPHKNNNKLGTEDFITSQWQSQCKIEKFQNDPRKTLFITAEGFVEKESQERWLQTQKTFNQFSVSGMPCLTIYIKTMYDDGKDEQYDIQFGPFGKYSIKKWEKDRSPYSTKKIHPEDLFKFLLEKLSIDSTDNIYEKSTNLRQDQIKNFIAEIHRKSLDTTIPMYWKMCKRYNKTPYCLYLPSRFIQKSHGTYLEKDFISVQYPTSYFCNTLPSSVNTILEEKSKKFSEDFPNFNKTLRSLLFHFPKASGKIVVEENQKLEIKTVPTKYFFQIIKFFDQYPEYFYNIGKIYSELFAKGIGEHIIFRAHIGVEAGIYKKDTYKFFSELIECGNMGQETTPEITRLIEKAYHACYQFGKFLREQGVYKDV